MHLTHIPVKGGYVSTRLHRITGLAHKCVMPTKHRRKTFLREWRLSKPGRTLEAVAAELHMSQPQLGRIERGDQPYNQDLLEALAELYSCTVADLLMRDPTDHSAIWSIWDNALPGERPLISASAEAVANALAEQRQAFKVSENGQHDRLRSARPSRRKTG